jgi:hypothetical protein
VNVPAPLYHFRGKHARHPAQCILADHPDGVLMLGVIPVGVPYGAGLMLTEDEAHKLGAQLVLWASGKRLARANYTLGQVGQVGQTPSAPEPPT